jgi:hypothetical protein
MPKSQRSENPRGVSGRTTEPLVLVDAKRRVARVREQWDGEQLEDRQIVSYLMQRRLAELLS